MVNVSVYKYCLKFALSDIAARKSRAFLTVLGVSIGIAALVALMSIGSGMRHEVENRLNEYFGVGVRLSGKSRVEVPEYLVDTFKAMSIVSDAYPAISDTGMLESRNVFIIGVPPGKLTDYFGTVQIVEGEDLRRGYALVSENIARRLGVKVGDRILVAPSSSPNKKYFTVCGIFDPGISFGTVGMVVITFEDAQELFDKPDYASEIVIKLKSTKYIETFADFLRKVFPEATVSTSKEVMTRINEILDIINVTLLSIASVSLVVAALSVMNTIMMVVRDRIREIGILKAIGATRSHVLAVFLGEALILSLMGGVAGVAMGMGVAYLAADAFARLTNIRVSPLTDPSYAAMGIGVAALVGVLSGFYPSWKGANIRPIEALKYE